MPADCTPGVAFTLIDQLFVDLRAGLSLFVFAGRQSQPHCQNAIGIETGIKSLKVYEALNQQSRRRQAG